MNQVSPPDASQEADQVALEVGHRAPRLPDITVVREATATPDAVEATARLNDYLAATHAAQAALLEERRRADDRTWVWHSHAALVAGMGRMMWGPPHTVAAAQGVAGPFARARAYAADTGAVYCEGYRVRVGGTGRDGTSPSSGAVSLRYAWCLDPATEEVADLTEPSESTDLIGGALYLGVGFSPAFLDAIEQRQPGHLHDVDHLRGRTGPVALHDALERTIEESLDEPLPIEPVASSGEESPRTPGDRDHHGSQVEAAIRSLHRHDKRPEDRATRAPAFMGVLDHVGPGVNCLRHGLLLLNPGSDAFPVVGRWGDPPPF